MANINMFGLDKAMSGANDIIHLIKKVCPYGITFDEVNMLLEDLEGFHAVIEDGIKAIAVFNKEFGEK